MDAFFIHARCLLDSETIPMRAATSFSGKMKSNSSLPLFVDVGCIDLQ